MSIWAMSFKRFDKGRNTPCSLQKCQIWLGLRLRACSHFWANWVPGSPILKSPHPGLRNRSFMCDVYMILDRTSFELKTSPGSSAHSFVAKISSPQSSPPCAPPATSTSCLLLPELQIQCKWTFWGIEGKRASRSFVLCETMQAEGEREVNLNHTRLPLNLTPPLPSSFLPLYLTLIPAQMLPISENM